MNTKTDPRIPLTGANQSIFEDRLKICKDHRFSLNTYDGQFIDDLTREFRNRKRDAEVGFEWAPSVRQWNYLIDVYEKCR